MVATASESICFRMAPSESLSTAVRLVTAQHPRYRAEKHSEAYRAEDKCVELRSRQEIARQQDGRHRAEEKHDGDQIKSFQSSTGHGGPA